MPVAKPVALIGPRPSIARDGIAAGDWILPDKLEPPRLHVDAVQRERLIAQLDQGIGLPLTLLLAPPGFGKTTLLAQWHAHVFASGRAQVAWLSLDEDDADPTRLLAYLALALGLGGFENNTMPLGVAHWRDLDPAATRTALLRAVRCAQQPLVLVLDDYDRAAGPAADELITLLVEHGGPRLHVLLATRRAPALPLARLAVRGALLQVGAEQLALNRQETRAMLGEHSSDEDARRLRHKTEGWPVAVRLAALWISGDGRRSEDVARFSGRTAGLAAYLAEQVVRDLDPELRDFLLETTVLERFNAALADTVRGRQDSGQLLARLGHFQGLLVPLDDDHEWFRYHPLFADYLHQQLDRQSPGLVVHLHRRAAQWCAAHDQLPEAVRHALRAHDVPLAAECIRQAGSWQMLLQHGTASVRALLCQFDPRVIRDTPPLNLTQAYLHMRLGEFSHAQMLLERFRDFPEDLRAPLERDYTVVVALLRDLMDLVCGNPRGIAQLAAQADALDEDDHLGRGTLLCICATTALGRSEFGEAHRLSQDAVDVMSRSDTPNTAGYALVHLGQSHFYRGALDQAEVCYTHALQLAQPQHGVDATLVAACRCLLAQLRAERGRYDEAADLLEGALDALEQDDGWVDVYAAGFSTALTLARQRDRSGRAAHALLDRIDALATRRHLTRLTELAAAWRLDVLLDLPGNSAIDAAMARSGGEAAFLHALTSGHGWRQGHALGFALARWHALCGRAGQAVAILHRQQQAAEAAGDRYHLGRIQLRLAMTLQQRGQIEAALIPLGLALDHIAGARAWQVVVDAGLPAKALLRSARQLDPQAAAGTTRALTIQTLLDKLSFDEAQVTELFSERELEVLAELAQGHSNKHIARRLAVSENTVKFHLKNLYRKLEATTRESALGIALQRGLIAATAPPG
ncbi:transcriptional regulator /transcriptional regulator, LuxR family [Pseudoxanthomonas sp. GM95]|uniref:LuxR C-terminal-related transcriptional regulator n=1 Tax=Pseudoxanthomonas sp. GM95 TaxID=1881043 RepID=UPI0008B6D3D4|nr:LuxR C-terminal-related transcriptional regulator [Pseudoxanthomonas sp. GM95]SEK53722.1 transcriptional regulator /transcriptional regulator, LuxR family [Pseudoxanthomonas sp. GM95]